MQLSIILIFIIFSQNAFSAIIPEQWTSVRALGMGNAYSSVVEGADSIFYNPAAIGFNSAVVWRIADPRIGADGLQAYNTYRTLTTAANQVTAINSLYGTYIWLGFGAQTALTFPYFACAGFTTTDFNLTIDNPAFTNVTLASNLDYGIAGTFGIDLIPKIFAIGTTLKWYKRNGTSLPIGASTIASLSSTAVTGAAINTSWAYALDAGVILRMPFPLVTPALSFVLQDAGNTSFVRDTGTNFSPIRQNMIIGGSIKFAFAGLSFTPSFDYKYADRTDIQVGQKIFVGAELDVLLASIRGGFYQGYYTWGVGANLGFLKLDAATYGVEMGEYPGQREDRRYMVQLTMQIGVDMSFFDFNGNGGGKGGRPRLFQRR